MRNFSFRFFVTLNEKDDVKIYLMKTNLQNQECQVDCQDLEPPFMHCPQIFFNIYKTFNLLMINVTVLDQKWQKQMKNFLFFFFW